MATPRRSLVTMRLPLLLLGTWVLWGQAMDPWGALTRFSLGEWPSREACEAERAKREQGLAPLVSYVCLAAPADPDAPKGT